MKTKIMSLLKKIDQKIDQAELAADQFENRVVTEVVAQAKKVDLSVLKAQAQKVQEQCVSAAQKVGERAVALVKKEKQDVLGMLAQDAELAAALRFVHQQQCPCVQVEITDLPTCPSQPPVLCDDRPPLAVPVASSEKAYVPACDRAPGKKSPLSRVSSFVARFTGTRLATCVSND